MWKVKRDELDDKERLFCVFYLYQCLIKNDDYTENIRL